MTPPVDRPGAGASPAEPRWNGLSLTLNGWGHVLGVIGVPGAIALYLVWWLTVGVGAKLDRIIQLLEQIARTLKVSVS